MLDIQKILEDGVQAPSGDNSQPWRFVFRDPTLWIYNLPEKDNPILNFKQGGSYIAHGALIENIIISASNQGYSTEIVLFPDPVDKNLVAKLAFLLNEKERDNAWLHSAIKERQTNRRAYKKGLTDEQKRAILKEREEFSGGNIFFVDGDSEKKDAAVGASAMERIALEREDLHRAFFSDIIWTEADEKQKTRGLYIKTLELPPPVQLMFRFLKNWSFVQLMNKIGFSKFAAKGNAGIYQTGTLGLVVVDGYSPEDFILAGRIFQRAWLRATSLGLSLQPLAGLLFLYQRVEFGEKNFLSDNHHKLVNSAYAKIKEVFKVKQGNLAMMFRVGVAPKPSAKTSRLAPVIE